MADRERKVAENVDGPFYVDESCIQCGNCADVAPENFTQGEEFYYVYKQPEDDEELENCQQALEECPVDAIGDDGETGGEEEGE
ncbi:MAG: ferredoxin [bacterium]